MRSLALAEKRVLRLASLVCLAGYALSLAHSTPSNRLTPEDWRELTTFKKMLNIRLTKVEPTIRMGITSQGPTG